MIEPKPTDGIACLTFIPQQLQCLWNASIEWEVSKRFSMRLLNKRLINNRNFPLLYMYRICGFPTDFWFKLRPSNSIAFPKAFGILFCKSYQFVSCDTSESVYSEQKSFRTRQKAVFKKQSSCFWVSFKKLGVEDAYASRLILNDNAVRIVKSLSFGQKSRKQKIIQGNTSRRNPGSSTVPCKL